MNNKGQMAATEAIVIIVLLVALGGAVWLLLHKTTEANIYQADSKPIVYQNEPNIHPLCGIIFSYNQKDKDVTSSHSQVNRIK
jgi:hypothetical protein